MKKKNIGVIPFLFIIAVFGCLAGCDGNGGDSDATGILVNIAPVWSPPPTDITINAGETYFRINGLALDANRPSQRMTCAGSESTCSFNVEVIGIGSGAAYCIVRFTAPWSQETCSIKITASDNQGASISQNVTITVEQALDISNCAPNPVDEGNAVQCDVTASGGTAQIDAINDTCGGVLAGGVYSFLPDESDGGSSCVAAVEIVEDTAIKDSEQITINKTNQAPVWNPLPSDISVFFGESYNNINGHADDADIPTQTLTCSKVGNDTCVNFDVAVSGNGTGSVDCSISFTVGAIPETCSVDVQVSDGSGGVITDTVNITVGACVYYVAAGSSGVGGRSWADAFSHPQTAVNTAGAGCQVWVAQGTYIKPAGAGTTDPVVAMKDGVEIYGGFAGTETVLSQRTNPAAYLTELDGENTSYSTVLGASNARFDGFTVVGGNLGYGAGMNNTNKNNLVIAHCAFIGNSSSIDGGGIYNRYSSPLIINCIFVGNSASYGGGIANSYSSPIITNCTFNGNIVAQLGGGVYSNSSSPTIINCIMWGDSASSQPEIGNTTSTPTVTYSDIQGGYTGTGNINSDPLFVAGTYGNYYLSQIAAGQASNSPCINAGSDTAANLGLNTRTTRTDNAVDASTVDMGYHYPIP